MSRSKLKLSRTHPHVQPGPVLRVQEDTHKRHRPQKRIAIQRSYRDEVAACSPSLGRGPQLSHGHQFYSNSGQVKHFPQARARIATVNRGRLAISLTASRNRHSGPVLPVCNRRSFVRADPSEEGPGNLHSYTSSSCPRPQRRRFREPAVAPPEASEGRRRPRKRLSRDYPPRWTSTGE